jgi:hypothetical protein
MLIEFTVGNYRSFKDPATLSMVATKIVSQDKRLDQENVIEVPGGPDLLTSAAVYGANASGKSNLVEALNFMRSFVLGSAEGTRATGGIRVEPFRLSTETINRPSHFEIVFVALDRQYRYGFEASRDRVHREWLYYVPSAREARLFEREGERISLSSVFREGRGLEEKTRPNALFLSVAAQFNGDTARTITNWFLDMDVISGLDDTWSRDTTLTLWDDPDGFAQVARFVKGLDLNIEDLKLEQDQRLIEQYRAEFPDLFAPDRDWKMPGAHRIKTMHRRFDATGNLQGVELFDLDNHESEGTRKLFALSGALLASLACGTELIADEFDARLHPLITRRLIELFNSREHNPRRAQLVITTQDTNLLDNRLFRRDQIWFTEKDRFGATHLYSLAEFRGVRNDASFERDYVRGRYGAIPFLGDPGRLTGNGDGQTTN